MAPKVSIFCSMPTQATTNRSAETILNARGKAVANGCFTYFFVNVDALPTGGYTPVVIVGKGGQTVIRRFVKQLPRRLNW